MKLNRFFTVMVVPQSGHGQVRQLMVSIRQLQVTGIAVASAIFLGLAGLGAHAYTLPRAVEAPVLAEENHRLQAQLAEANQTLGEVSALVDRLKTYDERLKELEAQGALPGMGPLTEEEMASRVAWLEGQAEAARVAEANIDDRIDRLRGDLLGFDEAHLGTTLQKLEDRDTVMPLLWPTSGPITSPFGYRKSPLNGDWGMHGGIDIGAKYGEPILATNRGTVTFSGWDQGHGKMVVVDHGQGVVTRYCHASSLYVEEGDQVTAGETIALVGSTGWSTGPHLHYEIFINGDRVDPVDYLP